MALAHDKDGFLTGPPAEIDSDAYAQALAIWRDIKGDTAAIRSSLSRRASEATRAGTAAKAAVATPSRQQSGLRLVQIERVAAGVVQGLDKGARVRAAKPRSGSMVAEAAVAASTSAKKVVAAKLAASAVKAATPERGAGGRFVSKGGSPGEKRKSKRNGDDEDTPGFLSRAAEYLSGAADKISTAASENEQLDPAIAAAKEVGDVISPIVKTTWGVGKGFVGLFKRDKDGKDKAIPWYRRIWGELRAINKKSGGGEGGGLLSGLLPSLGGLLGKIPGIGAIGKLMGGIGGGRGLLRFAAKAALPLAGIASAFKSFQTSTEEYAQRMGLTSGESLAKDLGIRFVGTLGDLGNTITFGLAGKLGEIMSPAMNDFVDRSVKAWTDTTTWFREKWEGAKELGGRAVDAVKAAPGRAWDATKSAASSAKDWVLGKTSKWFESGNKGAAAVSSGKGDYGGASYGTYQLSSSRGTLQKFLKSSGYEGQFMGLKPGTKEFNDKWQQIAKADPAFGNAQHDFIKASHFDPQMAKLKGAGIDLSKRGAAVQDSVWSTSVQFGGDSSLIQNALKGKDVAGMSDADIVAAIQDYKIKNNDSLFSKSSAGVRASTLQRAQNEKIALTRLAAADAASPAMAAMPSASARAVTAAPSVARVPSAAQSPESMTPPPAPQPPPTRIGTNGQGDKPVAVNIPKDVGQNVSDRGIAQVVTGGLGGYSVFR